MISRKTIFSLVLALLIFLGIRTWTIGHRDDCDRLGLNNAKPATVNVESGTRTVEMPCNLWLPRQPVWVQGVCLLDGAVGAVFVLSLWGDWVRWRRRRAGSQVSRW